MLKISRDELRALLAKHFTLLPASPLHPVDYRLDSLDDLLAVADTVDRFAFGVDTLTAPDGTVCGCPAQIAYGNEQYRYNFQGRIGFDWALRERFGIPRPLDDGHIVEVTD